MLHSESACDFDQLDRGLAIEIEISVSTHQLLLNGALKHLLRCSLLVA